jgi:hypothetical protein
MPGLTGAPGAEVPGATGAAGPSGAPGAANTEKGAAGTNGAPGAPGATGKTGATGPSEGAGTIGPTGPTGSALPRTLAPGATETGAWIVSSPHSDVLPFPQEAARISFPIPLAVERLTGPSAGCPAIETCHAKYVTKPETEEIAAGTLAMPGCKAVAAADPTLLEHPVAESGNLCVYAGFEKLTNAGLSNVINNVGETGASATGAAIAFETLAGGIPSFVKAQGTWAVTG